MSILRRRSLSDRLLWWCWSRKDPQIAALLIADWATLQAAWAATQGNHQRHRSGIVVNTHCARAALEQ